MLECQCVNISIEVNHKASGNEEPMTQACTQIRRKIFCLLCSRHDITYVFSVISQFLHSPLESHIKVVYRIMRRQNLVLDEGIMFKKNNDFKLKSYAVEN